MRSPTLDPSSFVPARRTRGLAGALAIAALAACGGSPAKPPVAPPPPPERPLLEEALIRLPAGSAFLAGFDVGRVSRAPMGQRTLEQLGQLEEVRGVLALLADCGIELADLGQAVVGATPDGQVVAMVRGTVTEPTLVGCLDKAVGDHGARLARSSLAGRTAYHVDAGADRGGADPWLAFLSPTTWIVSRTGPGLEASLAAATSQPALADLIAHTDSTRPMWFVAPVPAELGQSVVNMTGGMLSDPPVRVAGHADVSTQIDVQVRVAFASAGAAGLATAAVKMALAMAGGQLPEQVTSRLQFSTEAEELVAAMVLDEAGLTALQALGL